MSYMEKNSQDDLNSGSDPVDFVPVDPVHNLPLHSAADLTKGGRLALIKNAEQVYTLRITRSGKLILTK